ncbi:hypothetical protein RO21_06120 [[Actinobacillus] muris]|uniref:Uncharacterized protein n=1 Tax=Muribacter muris TaxID=67855 RepID=A0A0J5P4Y3_9PAST|nr:hypothetical protein [Muribacter muris]KMK51488.1 hypothetical protein RO21_06120 [[Actinobacillus] muris] [Muribacter muris]
MKPKAKRKQYAVRMVDSNQLTRLKARIEYLERSKEVLLRQQYDIAHKNSSLALVVKGLDERLDNEKEVILSKLLVNLFTSICLIASIAIMTVNYFKPWTWGG